MRILLIEDDGALLFLYAKALEGAGHEVTAVNDGAAAIELACGRQFDVVVSDLEIHRVNGDIVAQRVIERGVKIPFVFMSGNHDKLQKAGEALRELGTVRGLLEKPLSARTLVAKVSELFR